jgi:hypothetical protein
MPDIDLACSDCGTTTTVSEFVGDEALVCRTCGAKLARPEGRTVERPKPRLSHRTYEDTEETKTGAAGMAIEAKGVWPGGKDIPRQHRKAAVTHHWYAWVLFLALGALMGYARYGGAIDAGGLAAIHKYAVYVALALHVIIILKAFEDTVFQGILCLLVPFYTLYYILNVCDAVYLRAVVAAILVGVGQDAADVLQHRLFAITEFVRGWIASGG